jgi:hypothetical protein
VKKEVVAESRAGCTAKVRPRTSRENGSIVPARGKPKREAVRRKKRR